MTATAGVFTGGKPDNVPPVQQTFALVPVAGGSPMTATAGVFTGGKPDNVPPVQQTFALVPVAGGPTAGGPNTGGPTSGGPAIDGPAMGGGQTGSGTAQSGSSTLCICPMCKTTVTHPIGVPCASLTCPVCGSRLVNADPPAGASGGAAAATGVALTAGSTLVAQSKVVQVATTSQKIAIASTGRSLKSEIAPLFDKAPYFILFGLGTYEVIKNPYLRDAGKTGLEVAQYVVGEGGAAVICNNISLTALKALKDLKVKVYSGFTGTVQQALDIYAAGRLTDTSTTGIVVDDTTDHEGSGPPASKATKSKEKDSKTKTDSNVL
jgi:predicted Fe-Mo cluster-binding NifX family protein